MTQRRLSEESDIDIRRCKSQMKREKMYDGSNERQQDSLEELEEDSLWLKHHEDGGFLVVRKRWGYWQKSENRGFCQPCSQI